MLLIAISNMNKFSKVLIGFFLITFASSSHADTFEYGFMPVVGVYRSSLDSKTEVLPAVNLLSGLLIINSGRSSRYWIQGQYHSLDFQGAETELGETVSGFEVAVLYQSMFRLSRHFKPWLGMGLSIAALEFKDRYLTDSQGFLAEQFADTSETGIAVDLNFSTETDWFKDYGTGFSLRVSIPTNDVLAKVEAGFYITF